MTQIITTVADRLKARQRERRAVRCGLALLMVNVLALAVLPAFYDILGPIIGWTGIALVTTAAWCGIILILREM